MIVKIKKSEVDALKYACAMINLSVEFYTTESQPELVAAEIKGNLAWMSQEVTFYLGRMMETQLAKEELLKS